MRNARLLALVIPALAACSSSEGAAPPAAPLPRPAADAGVDAAPAPIPAPTTFDRGRPTGVLAFANGAPPRLSVIELNEGTVRPLATKDGPSEAPSFDETGTKLLYVHTEGASRAVRQIDVDGANDKLVATCGAPCEGPRFASDGAIWFVERPSGAAPQVMRLGPGATAASPWTVDLSGCSLRSFDLSFEGDRIVLSLDAASADPLCTTSKVGIYVLPLEATALDPPTAIAHPKIKTGSPISRATSWTATGSLMFVAQSANDGGNEVFERKSDGSIAFRGLGDSFAVMRDGDRRGDHLVYYFSRDAFDDGTKFISANGGGLGYYLTIQPGAGLDAPYSKTLGLFSWGAAPILGRP